MSVFSNAARLHGPASLWRGIVILAVTFALVLSTVEAAAARSRGGKVAVGVGAAILGVIILNEALKAEEGKKSHKFRTVRKHGDSFSSTGQHRRKPGNRAPKTEDDEDVARNSGKGDSRTKKDIETGAVSEPEKAPGRTAGNFKLPFVFKDKALLRQAGIAIMGYGDPGQQITHFKNKCYKKGLPDPERAKSDVDESDSTTPDGLYDISLSDEFLLKFVKRGFSLNSLCLAIDSGIKYDPETGKRLPTFVLSARKPDLDISTTTTVTNEIPLEVPNCFRFGRPYSDCKMNFDALSGTENSSEMRRRYAELGDLIDAAVSRAKTDGKWKAECAAPKTVQESIEGFLDCNLETDRQGWLQEDGLFPRNLSGRGTPNDGESWEKQRMIDVSPIFPDGYGYSIYSPVGGGGNPSVEAAEHPSMLDGDKVVTTASFGSFTETVASIAASIFSFGRSSEK